MTIIFCLLPVLIFLLCLYLLDNFKLVSRETLIICLLWGIVAALISYFLNTWLNNRLSLNFAIFSRYVAPGTEETTKALIIIYLLRRQKIGFAIDAVIYGFAAGAGFALAENVVYLYVNNPDAGLVIGVMRGFGTALMHGGCTAVFALLMAGSIQRDKPLIGAVIPGLIACYLLHSAFNHFLINPFLQTAIVVGVLPVVFFIVFQKSNTVLQNWLEIEFSNEVEIFIMLKQGKLSTTKAGVYLGSLKNHFAPEMILDLYCYFSLYLELSIKAKRNLMLKENGFPVNLEPDVFEKLTELKQLRNQIGKLGEIALMPLIRIKYRELWKLNQLKN